MYRSVKRGVDLVIGGLGLVVLSPVLGLTAAAVRVALGRPVLFRHERAGYRGHPFTLYKFRTMTDARDAQGELRPDRERLTAAGRWLRSFSIDELPELWNVVRGEMSLVGPRPLPVRYLPRYTAEERRRHDVRPGLTGWAQVNGRNAISWDERLALDVWYVDNRSTRLDLRILGRTALAVLGRQGVGPDHAETMDELRAESFGRTERLG